MSSLRMRGRVQIADARRFFTYDVLSEIVFGTPFGFVKDEKAHSGIITNVDTVLLQTGVISRIQWLITLATTPILRNLVMPSPKDKWGLGVVMRFGREKLDERIKNPSASPDILNQYV